jgi:hypothetical protein
MLLSPSTCWYGVFNTAISAYHFTSTVGAHMGGHENGMHSFGRET